jgi:hypothetical protein
MTLSDIIEALEAATEPSRELDEAIAITVLGMRKENHLAAYPDERPVWEFYDGNNGGSMEVMVDRFTHSVDAVLRLLTRAIPDANCWGIDKDERGIQAHVQRNGVKSGHWGTFSEHRSSAPIALIIAILKALQARGDA